MSEGAPLRFHDGLSILHAALQCPHEGMVMACAALVKSVKPMIRLLLKNILRTMPLENEVTASPSPVGVA